jgi:hypothetical protein
MDGLDGVCFLVRRTGWENVTTGDQENINFRQTFL